MKNTRYQRRFSSEDGLVFELTILILPAIILLVAIIINVGNITVQRTAIQGASDAAAHAGTIVLDNTQDGWTRALEVTKNTFRFYEHQVHGLQSVDWTTPLNNIEYHGDDIVVFIERGLWNPDSGFTSLEAGAPTAPGWAGVAAFAAANAVRARIEVSDVPNFFANLLQHTADNAIVSETLAVNGKVQETCVAPFAIPVCSLMSMEGGQLHFDKDLMCEKDRIITASDPSHLEYWTPDFFYDPGSSEIIDPGYHSSVFHSPNYVQTDDNFAVVGLPASHGVLNENEVRRIINNGGPRGKPCVNARLGESFNVLPAGLTEPATDFAVWAQISNPFLHPEMKVEFRDALRAPNSEDPVFVQPNWVGLPPREGWLDQNCPSGVPCSPTQPSPLAQKVCDSHRFQWNGCESFTIPGTPLWCDPRNFPFDAHGFGPHERGPVWQIKVPVIGDMRASATCDSALYPPGNRFIDPNEGDIKIIGFVTLNIYDVDIGKPKPHRSPLTIAFDGLLSDTSGAALLTQGGEPAWDPSAFSYVSPLQNYAPACNKPGCEPFGGEIMTPETWIANSDASEWMSGGNWDPLIGWLYRHDPSPCNVVRARIDCSTGFFQVSGSSPEDERARIVE